MEISLKNILLAGIGTMAYSYEKSSSLIEGLIKKGEITVNQGKELNEELKRTVSKGKDAQNASAPLTTESLKEVLAGLNLATQQELDELKIRITKLEGK